MAIDAFSQRSILGIMQALFDATPGAELNNIFTQVFEQGISLPLMVNILTKNPVFDSHYSYPDTLPTATFATQFVNDLLGNRVTQTDKNALVATIIVYISSNTDKSRDEVMSEVFTILADIPNNDQTWGAAASHYKQTVTSTILNNLLGNSSEVAQLKTDLAQVITEATYKDSTALGSLVMQLIGAVDSFPETDPHYGAVVQRFHNKIEVSEYYSLNLLQSAPSVAELSSVIAPIDSNYATVTLAKMKAGYFVTHTPYVIDALVITSNIDLTNLDISSYKKLVIDAGSAQGLPRAVVTMKAAQAAAFGTIIKGSGDKLAVVDTIANINAKVGLLTNADSLTGIVRTSVNLTQVDLTRLTELTLDDYTNAGIKATVNAAQAVALLGHLGKGTGDTLAVVDSIANINVASNLSAADSVTGVVSASVDLANTSLSRLTDLVIGMDGGAAVNLTMWAEQAEKLNGHIVKAPGSTLILYVVPSEISTTPSIADAIIANVAISRDLRALDLSKCIALKISDGTNAAISATLLAAQAQSLSGRVTKGVSDILIVDDTPTNVVAAPDLSVADVIYATDLSGNNVTINEPELVRITELRTAGQTTLNSATTAGIVASVAKIVLSAGTLIVNAANGNLVVPFATMTKISSLTAQPNYAITLTEAKNTGLSTTLSHLHVAGTGQLNIIGATSEHITIADSDLALVASLLAAPSANLTFTGATGAGFVANLAKLKVSGAGKISVVGGFDENLSLDEALLLPLKSLTTNGSGSISVAGLHNENLAAVLGITATVGTGSVRITGAALENLTISKTVLDSEPVSSVTASPGQSITLSDATAAALTADAVKLHVSGAGKINVVGATDQNFSFTETALGTYGNVAATGNGNITITNVTTEKLASDLAFVTVAGGKINMIGATGANLSVIPSDLLVLGSLAAALNENITLTAALNASLATDLAKLITSGTGKVFVTGALNESFNITEALLLPLKSITANGSGSLSVTGVHNANLTAVLGITAVSGTGSVTITGATGENITIAHSDLASVSSLIAAPGANLTLAGATDAGLVANLAKLKVSGAGKISVIGGIDENFNVDEALLLPLKSLTTNGVGSISVTGLHNNNLATILGITATAGTGSVRITGATGENLTISRTVLDSEPVSSVTVAPGQNITLLGATAAALAPDTAKLHVSGAGKINVVGAADQNLSFTEAALGTYGTVAATGNGNITITNVTAANLAGNLSFVAVASGKINMVGIAGANLSVTPSDLVALGSLTAATNANITLTAALGASLATDLPKLTTSGAGKVFVTGNTNENFNITEALLLPLKSITANGNGSISVTGVHDANLAAVLEVTAINGTGSVSITGAALENLVISKTALTVEPVSSVTAAAGQNITLADADAATLAVNIAKLHVSGAGKINILGAANQDFNFTESEIGAYGNVAATGIGNITITDVTAAKLASDLTAVSAATGTINLLGKDGETLSLTPAQLSGPANITADSGDKIVLTNAIGSSLISNLSKLHVSGGGAIEITGASNETLTIPAASTTDISGISATGTGGVAITNAAAANVSALLNKAFISGTGTASVTFTDAAIANVTAAVADSKQLIASDLNGKIEITNAAGKQTFYASPGTNGTAKLITHIGDSTAITSTCDVLNVIVSKAIVVDLSAISAISASWNLGTTAKATALNGTGLVLDPLLYDVYLATVGGNDYIVYETAVDGSTYEAIKIVGTVNLTTLQIPAGVLYL